MTAYYEDTFESEEMLINNIMEGKISDEVYN